MISNRLTFPYAPSGSSSLPSFARKLDLRVSVKHSKTTLIVCVNVADQIQLSTFDVFVRCATGLGSAVFVCQQEINAKWHIASLHN